MPRPALPATATLAVLLAAGAAAAQPPTAPPPHPTLDELVREYRRLGLPEPPPDAELVRFGFRDNNPDRLSLLAFKTPPTRLGTWPRYWVSGRIWDHEQFSADWEEPAGPGAEAARGLVPGDADKRVILAIQCQAHDRHQLARAVFDSALAELWERTEHREPSDETPMDILRGEAWNYWAWDRLSVPGTDRREPLRRLRALAAEDARFRTAANAELLGALEFTVECPPARPGTVEALIDSLTDYWGFSPLSADVRPPHPDYTKLADLGFDAVPALIDHLHDPRVTRGERVVANQTALARMRVGDIAAELLFHLLGNEELEAWDQTRDGRPDPELVRRWWAKARAVGEEKWLLDHVIWSAPDQGWYGVHPRLLRIIRVKYPGRLPELYRTLLRREPRAYTAACMHEIRESTLPRAQQIALFEAGARHQLTHHRVAALTGLGRIDPALARQPALRLFQTFQPEPAGPGRDGWWAYGLVGLAEAVGDRACWDALAAAGPRLPVKDRVELLGAVARTPKPDQPDPHRRYRLRFLVTWLGDQARVVEQSGTEVHTSYVCDYAADDLAGLLGFWPGNADGSRFVTYLDRGPLTRFAFRAAVWQAAARELRRLGG